MSVFDKLPAGQAVRQGLFGRRSTDQGGGGLGGMQQGNPVQGPPPLQNIGGGLGNLRIGPAQPGFGGPMPGGFAGPPMTPINPMGRVWNPMMFKQWLQRFRG